MITNGWFSWGEREPGIADKVYSQPNAAIGVVPHSMEGFYAGARSRLFSTQRLPDGRYSDYAAASWCGSILLTGKLIQHYSIYSSCWTSGARYPNTNFVAFECEGVAGKPLTQAQTITVARVISEISERERWTPRRPTSETDVSASLYEHRECKRWGALPTACPSSRLNWVDILNIVEGGEMKSFLAWEPVGAGGLVWFVGPQGAKHITSQPVVDELVRIFGPISVAISRQALEAIGVRA